MASAGCGVRLAAVIPPQCHRIVLNLSIVMEQMRMLGGNVRLAFGKVEANFGTDGIRFLVHLPERHRFHDRWVFEIQGTKRHVDRVACHVAQRAGAEILPAAPVERLVNSISILWIWTGLIRPQRSRPNPGIPLQCCWNRIFSQRTVHRLLILENCQVTQPQKAHKVR